MLTQQPSLALQLAVLFVGWHYVLGSYSGCALLLDFLGTEDKRKFKSCWFNFCLGICVWSEQVRTAAVLCLSQVHV